MRQQPSSASSDSPAYTPEPIVFLALKVGVITGCSGFLLGGLSAVVRSSPTVGLFSTGTALNCGALGFTYTVIRSAMFRALSETSSTEDVVAKFTPREELYISGVSGTLTGLTLGLLRGRSNAIPGAIVWGLVGLGGQFAYHVADARHTQNVLGVSQTTNKPSLTDRVFRSKWNPIKKLTDEEYEKMLNGKLLAVEAELAITNEEIEKLEKQH